MAVVSDKPPRTGRRPWRSWRKLPAGRAGRLKNIPSLPRVFLRRSVKCPISGVLLPDDGLALSLLPSTPSGAPEAGRTQTRLPPGTRRRTPRGDLPHAGFDRADFHHRLPLDVPFGDQPLLPPQGGGRAA